MKKYQSFLLCLVCLLSASVVQAQGTDWAFTLNEADVQAYSGARALFSGEITNNTGSDLLLTRADLSFFTTSPANMSSYDFTDSFLNTGGIIPVSGYAGSIFYVDWAQDAPLGTSGFGTVSLEANSMINPSAYHIDFTASTPQPVPEASPFLSLCLLLMLGLAGLAPSVWRRMVFHRL